MNAKTPLAEILDNYSNGFRDTLRLRDQMNNLCAEMRSTLEASLNIPSETRTFYKDWRAKSFELMHLEKVNYNLQKLKAKHKKFSNPFLTEIILLKEPLKCFRTSSESIRAMYSALVNSDKTDLVQTTAAEANLILDQYAQCQNDILQHLGEAKHIFLNYNERRIMWAHFLMGIDTKI